MRKNTLKAIAIVCLVLLPDIVAFAAESLTVGIFPRRNGAVTLKMFTPLFKHVEQETGLKIRVETAKNFPEFWRRVKQNRYDIVHFNQLHSILSAKFGYHVFAKNEEFGVSSLSSSIIVRKDSGINSIKDLADKKIIFGGGKLAMIAYVGVKSLLRKNGLNDSEYKTLVAKNPPNSILAVYFKKASAAGIGNIGLDVQRIRENINTDELKFLITGESLPHLPWAFAEGTDTKIKEKISDSLLTLYRTDKGKKVLKKAGLTNILFADDDEYRHVGELYREYLKMDEVHE